MTDAEHRVLLVDGLVNARDLGGLPRGEAGSTPRGVFFRSESVDRVTDTGWAQIHAAGIRTVVDLRQDGERARDTGSRPDWLHTVHVDHDGLRNAAFWAGYWDNGLVATPLYYLPHLAAMPERTVAALTALVEAPPGGVLFHCAAGRDRTGLLAALLLAAAGAEPDAIVEDYLETIRLGPARAAASGEPDPEPGIREFLRERGTTSAEAVRAVLTGLDLDRVLDEGGATAGARAALTSWRGALQR